MIDKENENDIKLSDKIRQIQSENHVFIKHIPIILDRQKGKVNNISTLYGKKNLEN